MSTGVHKKIIFGRELSGSDWQIIKAKIIFDMQETIGCQVCFQDPKNDYQHCQLIECKGCRATAHRYCYLPKAEGLQFTCDVCLAHEKNPACKFCQNKEGLMKKVGSAYAHPLCLLFCPSVVADDFHSLSFLEVETHRSSKKLQCGICQKTNASVIACQSSKCHNASHLYCAIKTFNSEEGKGWKMVTKVLKGERTNDTEIENLLLRTIKTKSKFLGNELGVNKNFRAKELSRLLYCHEHSSTIVDCICDSWDIDKSYDWLYCDSCLKWEHLECVNISKEHEKEIKEENIAYICYQCKAWKEWIEGQVNVLPTQLPKLQIYDFIYLQCCVEKWAVKTPLEIKELVMKIPVLPGSAFGELFFKKEIASKLTWKIHMQEIRGRIQDLQTKDQLAKYFLTERRALDIIWLLVKGNIFGSHQKQSYPFPLEEGAQDTSFVEEMLSAIILFELQFGSRYVKKLQDIRGQIGSLPEGLIKEEEELRLSMDLSLSRGGEKGRSQQLYDNLVKEVNQRLAASLKDFKQNLASDKEGQTLRLFRELHMIKRIASKEQILEDLPESLFTKALLNCQNAEQSVTFMNYVGEFNLLEKKMASLKDEKGKLPPEALPKMEDLCFVASKLKEKICYEVDDNNLQKLLITEVYERESEGRVPCGREFERDNGYNPDEWWEKPLCHSNIHRLKSLVAVHKLNDEYPKELHLTVFVMEEMKKSKLNSVTNTKVQKLREKVQYPSVGIIFDSYLNLHNQTLKMALRLGFDPRPQECLLFVLRQHLHFDFPQKKEEEVQIFLNYLGAVKRHGVNLSFFSTELQACFKAAVTRLWLVLEQREFVAFSSEEFDLLRFWNLVLRLKDNKIQRMVQADRRVQSQFMCELPSFEEDFNTENMTARLRQARESYKGLDMEFRVKKVDTIIEWVNAFRTIQKFIPLQYIIDRSEWEKWKSSSKPALKMATCFARLLQALGFPKNKLRINLEEGVNQSQQLKDQFWLVNKDCHWEFNLEKDHYDCGTKKHISYFTELCDKMAKVPINLHIELSECQIWVERFKKSEEKARYILKSGACPSAKLVKQAKRVINSLGALPIQTQLVQQLFNFINLENSIEKEQEEEVHLLLSAFSERKRRISEEEANKVLVFFGKGRERDEQLSKLKKEMREVSGLRQNFEEQLCLFNSRGQCFNPGEIKLVEEMLGEYRSLGIRNSDLERIENEFSFFTLAKKMVFDDGLKKLGREDLQITIKRAEVVHPCFFTPDLQQSVAALKTNLAQ